MVNKRAVTAALLCLAAAASVPRAAAQTTAVLVYDPGAPAIAFAAGDLRAALQQKGFTVIRASPARLAAQTAPIQIAITTTEAARAGQPVVTGLTAQGYAIRRVMNGRTARWWVIGGDAAGAMYGALELAESVRIHGTPADVGDRQTSPHVLNRGIKFNIPLDARTPSYSDDSSSAQANIAEMWSMEFWTRFLDEMARSRYNLLSLWSLSPFPSLVKVPEYPGVALADVRKKAGPLWDATLTGTRMYDPGWSLTTVKSLTIDEKIAFWRQVMQYAKDRGIDVTIFTWNIFVYGTEGSAYGITDAPSNAATKDYFRTSVRTLFNTYPLLAGIGITSGEHMGDLNAAGKEQWLWDTYGLGVKDAMDAAKDPASPFYNPTRVIRLIHRAHQTDLNTVVSRFKELPGYAGADATLTFSFKYSQAHMYSSTRPRFIYENGWFGSIPAGKKTWLTVRNDDMYYMRWGDPDFVRAYISNLPDLSKIAGFYMGPDGYTWGREFVSREPDSPRQQVIEKMWYSFLLWGRLSYEPSLPNIRFQEIVGSRFPQVPSGNLFRGWASVSKIVPLMTRFYWGSLDFMWYPEACWSNDGFESVQKIIDERYDPMKPGEDGETPGIMSVKAFVNGESPDGRMTPLQVADSLQRYADAGLQDAGGLAPGTNKELRQTLGDIKAMAWLGRYYAEKIRGAVDLARYQRTRAAVDHTNATSHLQNASADWRQYAALWSAQYQGQVLTRMGLTPVDISAIQAYVDGDIPAPIR